MNPRKLLLLASLLGAGLLAACDSGSGSSDSPGTDPGTNNPGGGAPGGGTPSGGDHGIPWNGSVTFGTMQDSRDGKTYRTVQIGTKTWMAQNLNHAVSGSLAYQNSEDSAAKYGRLYSWTLAMSLADTCATKSCVDLIGENHQGVCPAGWHVSTQQEWNSIADLFPNQTDMGHVLRSSKGWEAKSPTANGSDTLGLRVLPAGSGDGVQWARVGLSTAFWTPYEQEYAPGLAGCVRFDINLGGGSVSKAYNYSVRCVKN